MPFDQNQLPTWNKEGVEPPQSLKDNGWQPSQKPPADYFNWFFNKTFKALLSLFTNAQHKEEKGQPNGYASLDGNGKVPSSQLSITKDQVGLGNVDNVKQATKTEFDAHVNDDTKHITAAERNTWNSKLDASEVVTTPNPNKILKLDANGKFPASAIPNLDWSKITTGKPTTAVGYGITDVYTKTEVDNKIDPINQALSQQNKQSATIGHGLNVINASQNSPLDIQIEGRTLVNLLGTQGRTATSATVTLDPAKYYVLVNEDGTNVTVDGVSQTVPYKFTGKSSVSLSWTSGKVALYEVDVNEYSNILTTWAASEVNRRYPYVDSVQHVQNPYVIAEGENLFPPFTEWTHGGSGGTSEVITPYKFQLNATNWAQYRSIKIPLVKNQQYTISVIGQGRLAIDVIDKNNTFIVNNVSGDNGITLTFTPIVDGEHEFRLKNGSQTGTFIFEKPMLNLGSTAKPFVPRNPSMLFAEVKLGAIGDKKDILFKDNGDWKVLKWIEKDVVLDGKLPWAFSLDYTGYKRVQVSGLNSTLSTPNNQYYLVKYEGKLLKDYGGNTANFTSGDMSYCYNNVVSITISDIDSGWGENYTPTAQEIQAYFYGWRMCNGTYGQPYDGTGTKTWYPIGDTDLSRATTTCPTSAAPTIAEGKISYYKLSYVRSTPVTEVVTDKVEGDLVVNGSTQIEVGSGVIVREKITPSYVSSTKIYYINRKANDANDSPLKYKASKILSIFKNSIKDNSWIVENSSLAYGNQRAYVNENQYDVTAEYTVTYLVLDRHLFTTNILAVTATYDSSLKSVVDSVVAKQSDLASNQQALIRSVAELYKRVKALGG
jgi:hypothetical protein